MHLTPGIHPAMRRRRITVAILLLGAMPAALAAGTPAAPGPVEVTRYHEGPWERDIGYAQAVRAGQLLFVSGTVGAGDLDDPKSMEDAVSAAYDRLKKTLAAQGAGFQNVVKETIYTRDIEALKAAAPVRLAYYDRDRLPASTWVQVQRLFEEHYVIEVELVAVLP